MSISGAYQKPYSYDAQIKEANRKITITPRRKIDFKHNIILKAQLKDNNGYL